ncbi:hypothetical protein H4R33_001602 [Dimargaris cristalligena]|nr:hypothetical protein H4R33_001602 [Dimargaris cristalligena]
MPHGTSSQHHSGVRTGTGPGFPNEGYGHNHSRNNHRVPGHLHPSSPYMSSRTHSSSNSGGSHPHNLTARRSASHTDPLLQRYVMRPPDDLPRLCSNTSVGYPDYFPQDPAQPEDQLIDTYVRNGLADQPLISSETSSMHDSIIDRLQDQGVMNQLAKFAVEILEQQQRLAVDSRLIHSQETGEPVDPSFIPSVGDVDSSTATSPFSGASPRWHLATPIPPKSFFHPPPVRPVTELSDRETWWKHLTDPAAQLSTLARSVPSLYGKDRTDRLESLLKNICQRSIPMTRALWAIRVFGCDEIQTALQSQPQLSPSQASDSLTTDWTRLVLNTLRSVLTEVPGRDPKTSEVGADPRRLFPDPDAQLQWIDRWSYLWRLVRVQCDQELVDIRHLLRWLIEVISTCSVDHFVLLLPSLYEYIPDIKRARFLLRLLVSALTDRALGFASQFILPASLETTLVDLHRSLFFSCPDVFMDPSAWADRRPVWEAIIFGRKLPTTNDRNARRSGPSPLPSTDDWSPERALWEEVNLRNTIFHMPTATPPTLDPPPLAWPDYHRPAQNPNPSCNQEPDGPTMWHKLVCSRPEVPESISNHLPFTHYPIATLANWFRTAYHTYFKLYPPRGQTGPISPARLDQFTDNLPKRSQTAQFLKFSLVYWLHWVIHTDPRPSQYPDAARVLSNENPNLSTMHTMVLCCLLNVLKLVGIRTLLNWPAAPSTDSTLGGLTDVSNRATPSRGDLGSALDSATSATETLHSAYTCRWVEELFEQVRLAGETDIQVLVRIGQRQDLIQEVLESFMADPWPTPWPPLIARVLTELTRANLFSYAHYAQRIIARGELSPDKTGSLTPLDAKFAHQPYLQLLGTLSEGELQARQIALYKANHLKFDHPESVLDPTLHTPEEYQEFRTILQWQHHIASRLPWLITHDAQTRSGQVLSSALLFRLLPAPSKPTTFERLQADTWAPVHLFPHWEPAATTAHPLAMTGLSEQVSTVAETVVQSFALSRLGQSPKSALVHSLGWSTIFGPANNHSTAPLAPLTPYTASRLLETWLLPMARLYTVRDTEIGVDNWKIMTQPGASLLNARQLASLYYTLAQIDGAMSPPPSRGGAEFPNMTTLAVSTRWEIDQWLLRKGVDRRTLAMVIDDFLTWRSLLPWVSDDRYVWKLLLSKLHSLLETGLLNVPLIRYLVTFAPQDGVSDGGTGSSMSPSNALQDLRGQWHQWHQQFLRRSAALATVWPLDTLWQLTFDYIPLGGTLTTADTSSSDTHLLTGDQLAQSVGQHFTKWTVAYPDQPPLQFYRQMAQHCGATLVAWANTALGSDPASLAARLRQVTTIYADYMSVVGVVVNQEPPAFITGGEGAHPFVLGAQQMVDELSTCIQELWVALLAQGLAEASDSRVTSTDHPRVRNWALVATTLAQWVIQLTAQHQLTHQAVITRILSPLVALGPTDLSVKSPADIGPALMYHTQLIQCLRDLVRLLLGDATGLRASAPNTAPGYLGPSLGDLHCTMDHLALQAELALQFDQPHSTHSLLPMVVPLVRSACLMQYEVLTRGVDPSTSGSLEPTLVIISAALSDLTLALARSPWVHRHSGPIIHQIYDTGIHPQVAPLDRTDNTLASNEALSSTLPPVAQLFLLDWFGRLLFPLVGPLPSPSSDSSIALAQVPVHKHTNMDSFLASVSSVAIPLTSRVPPSIFQGLGLVVMRDTRRSRLPLDLARLSWLLDAHALQASDQLVSWWRGKRPLYHRWVRCAYFPDRLDDLPALSPAANFLVSPEQGEVEDNQASYPGWLLRALHYYALRTTPYAEDHVSCLEHFIANFNIQALSELITYHRTFTILPDQPSGGSHQVVGDRSFLLCHLNSLPVLSFPGLEINSSGSVLTTAVVSASDFQHRTHYLGNIVGWALHRLVGFAGYPQRTMESADPLQHPATGPVPAPLPEGQIQLLAQTLTGCLDASLDQLEWFIERAPTFATMQTLGQCYAYARSPQLLSAAASPPRQQGVYIDHVYCSLWLRLRTLVPLLPHLIKSSPPAKFICWVTTLIQLLNRVLGPLVRGHSPFAPALFNLALDIVSVCLDVQPTEVRQALIAELRQLTGRIVLEPRSSVRLRRILPFEIYNIYTADWKPNPHITLNPWQWLETAPSAPAADKTDDPHHPPGVFANLNCTSVSLALFNAKRYRILDDNIFIKYARNQSQTLALLYGIAESSASNSADHQRPVGPGGMGLASGQSATPFHSTPESATLGISLLKTTPKTYRHSSNTPAAPSYRAPTSYSTHRSLHSNASVNSADTQEEGEIPLKRKRSP